MKTIVMAALACLLVAGAASARGRPCAPRDTVLERLGAKFGEARRGMGLGANNHVVEVFASEESGTWTITVTSPTGLTCLVASGRAWEALQEVVPEGDPA